MNKFSFPRRHYVRPVFWKLYTLGDAINSRQHAQKLVGIIKRYVELYSDGLRTPSYKAIKLHDAAVRQLRRFHPYQLEKIGYC